MSYANFIHNHGARVYCQPEDDQQPQPRPAESAGSSQPRGTRLAEGGRARPTSQQGPGNLFIGNVVNFINGGNTTINMPDVRFCSSNVEDGDPFRFKRRGGHAGSSEHVWEPPKAQPKMPAPRHKMLDKLDGQMIRLNAAARAVDKMGTNEQMKRVSQIQVKAEALNALIQDLLAGRAGTAPDKVMLAVSATYDDLSVLVKEAEALGTAAASMNGSLVRKLYVSEGPKGFQVYIGQR